ncbi:hypothetical protein E1B28_000058 [Marasmius oreades]|uniref:Uncharacterized protein n=1 Tax=Marasmius oreades TaxID=181124 RepID=A0A9P8ADY4_9AGAR|nr:uncharacterized protein E1B28_000058 [Marasmius oreades]KAG7098084.1 hypothetical protein E1B28_000058 [Marasmius oreades]
MDLEEPRMERFAQLRLPNGQVAWSLWQEQKWEDIKVRRAWNIKLNLAGEVQFAEVLYYFTLIRKNVHYTLAAVWMFLAPDQQILDNSLSVLWVCEQAETDTITIIDVKWINGVIAMIPFRRAGLAWDDEGDVYEYFVLEKLFCNSVVPDYDSNQDGENV